MDELSITAKIALSNTFVMYFKAQSYHWNVEGKNFTEMHGFFGGVYEELHAAIDPLAEEIRTLGVYAPVSLNEVYASKTINEDVTKPDSVSAMLMNLLDANSATVESLNKAFDAAVKQNNQGFANFLADRLDKHAKHAWMIKSFLKGSE